MLDFVLPESVANQLQEQIRPLPLCDASGRMLGYFVPHVDSTLYEGDKPDLSDEELQHIEQSTEWYSTKEVLQRLESLRDVFVPLEWSCDECAGRDMDGQSEPAAGNHTSN